MCKLYGYCVDLFKCALDFFGMGSFSVVSKLFIDGMCAVVALVTKTIIGATFHPCITMLLMNGWCFVVFLSRASVENLSL